MNNQKNGNAPRSTFGANGDYANRQSKQWEAAYWRRAGQRAADALQRRNGGENDETR